VKVLRDPSTFYVFSVVGIDENFADMIDIHRDKMSRKEFCWLTDPLPPTAETRSNTSLSLKWDSIRFCGVDVSVVSDSITYILEGCEGQEWKGGIASKFVTDLSASDYKLIAKGSNLNKILLEDLKPARWYHFRLTIQYLTTTVTSTMKSYATICSPPNQPNQPYIYLIMNANNMFENKGRRDPQVRLTWNEPSPNGSSIKKYHVQVIEFFQFNQSESSGNGNSNINGNNRNLFPIFSPESENELPLVDGGDGDGGGGGDQLKGQILYTNSSGQVFVGQKWRTVYCNLVRSTLLDSPKSEGCKAWGIRIRALNSSGWSPYSETVYLDHQTHAQLFSVANTNSTTSSTSANNSKLPPLQKQHISTTATTTSGARSAPRLNQSQSFPHSMTTKGEGSEYHHGNVDIWRSSVSSFSSERMRGSREEGNRKGKEQEEDWTYRSSSPTLQLRYNQPRCKTPSLLLPSSSPTRPSAAEAVNRSLATSQQQYQQSDALNTTALNVDPEVLEREVER
jgi:hypothetical protein